MTRDALEREPFGFSRAAFCLVPVAARGSKRFAWLRRNASACSADATPPTGSQLEVARAELEPSAFASLARGIAKASDDDDEQQRQVSYGAALGTTIQRGSDRGGRNGVRRGAGDARRRVGEDRGMRKSPPPIIPNATVCIIGTGAIAGA